MQSKYTEITKLGAEIVAITVDTPEQNAGVKKRAKLDFAILSDAQLELIDAFGLRHAEASVDGGDVARPAVFIVDTEGNIAWRELTDNVRVRVRPEKVIDQLRKL